MLAFLLLFCSVLLVKKQAIQSSNRGAKRKKQKSSLDELVILFVFYYQVTDRSSWGALPVYISYRYYDCQLSKARWKFGDKVYRLKLRCYHEQLI